MNHDVYADLGVELYNRYVDVPEHAQPTVLEKNRKHDIVLVKVHNLKYDVRWRGFVRSENNLGDAIVWYITCLEMAENEPEGALL